MVGAIGVDRRDTVRFSREATLAERYATEPLAHMIAELARGAGKALNLEVHFA